MGDIGPAVIKIDDFSGREDGLELDPARLAPDSPVPAQFARNLYTDDTGGRQGARAGAVRRSRRHP